MAALLDAITKIEAVLQEQFESSGGREDSVFAEPLRDIRDVWTVNSQLLAAVKGGLHKNGECTCRLCMHHHAIIDRAEGRQ